MQCYEFVLDSIKTDDINTLEEHCKYLALGILTWQPQLIISFYTPPMFVIKDKHLKPTEHFTMLVTTSRRQTYYVAN